MVNNKTAKPNESCADCVYHHCKKSCQKDNSETCLKDGECLFTWQINRQCWERRCEYFKLWQSTKK